MNICLEELILTLRKFEAMDTEIIASRLNLDLDGAKNLINEWNIGMLSCPNKQASFKTITAMYKPLKRYLRQKSRYHQGFRDFFHIDFKKNENIFFTNLHFCSESDWRSAINELILGEI